MPTVLEPSRKQQRSSNEAATKQGRNQEEAALLARTQKPQAGGVQEDSPGSLPTVVTTAGGKFESLLADETSSGAEGN